ncbi:hypothetical protein KI387_014005, partial [Taxus chinensis]
VQSLSRVWDLVKECPLGSQQKIQSQLNVANKMDIKVSHRPKKKHTIKTKRRKVGSSSKQGDSLMRGSKAPTKIHNEISRTLHLGGREHMSKIRFTLLHGGQFSFRKIVRWPIRPLVQSWPGESIVRVRPNEALRLEEAGYESQRFSCVWVGAGAFISINSNNIAEDEVLVLGLKLCGELEIARIVVEEECRIIIEAMQCSSGAFQGGKPNKLDTCVPFRGPAFSRPKRNNVDSAIQKDDVKALGVLKLKEDIAMTNHIPIAENEVKCTCYKCFRRKKQVATFPLSASCVFKQKAHGIGEGRSKKRSKKRSNKQEYDLYVIQNELEHLELESLGARDMDQLWDLTTHLSPLDLKTSPKVEGNTNHSNKKRMACRQVVFSEWHGALDTKIKRED